VTDHATWNDLANIWVPHVRLADMQRIAGGVTAFSYKGAPVIPSYEMPTGSNYRCILMLDPSVIELAVLQDFTTTDLAKTNDSDKWFTKWYGTGILKYEAFCSIVFGIAASS